MGNKVRVLYASVGVVRNCYLYSWHPYFRSSMRILFMLPVLGFFEEVRESFGVDVSIFKISIFFPVGCGHQCQVRWCTERIHTPSTDLYTSFCNGVNDTGTITSFYNHGSDIFPRFITTTNFRRQLQNLTLEAPKKIRAQSVVELFHEILRQFFVIFLESLKISPLIRIEEVHEVE